MRVGIDWEGTQENFLSGWKYFQFWPCHVGIWIREEKLSNKLLFTKGEREEERNKFGVGISRLKTATHKIDRQQGFTV